MEQNLETNIIEGVKFTGDVSIKLFDEFGNLKDERQEKNLVVTTGRTFIIARMATTGQPNQMSHMAIGSSSTAPAAGQTALTSQLAIVALATAGGSPSGTSITYTATFGAGVGTSTTVQEAGIFNAASAGTMLARLTFTAVNKGASDILTITWTISAT